MKLLIYSMSFVAKFILEMSKCYKELLVAFIYHRTGRGTAGLTAGTKAFILKADKTGLKYLLMSNCL